MTTPTTEPKVRDTMSVVLLAATVALTLTTAWIHYSLGGILFLLNAAGYVALAIAVVGSFVIGASFVRRLGWVPRLALMAYAAVTIGAWAIMGPYFQLAYIAKAVEVALIAVLAIDLYRTYGGPAELIRRARVEVSRFGSAIAG